MHLIVSDGVTAIVASTTPAARPASIVRPGVSFPCSSRSSAAFLHTFTIKTHVRIPESFLDRIIRQES